MSKLRLYLIGVIMGIADLIPGVSGGTVAFISGIYKELLISIKTLRIQSFKKIAWPFLLPLGAGMATSLLLFSKLFYFLLLYYKLPLFGLFFGMIAASTWICAKETKLKKPIHYVSLIVAAGFSFMLTLLPTSLLFGSSFFGIFCAAILATGAMLLPGISGSYLLQVIGVYPLVIYALNKPTEPFCFQLLIAMAMGISLGFIIFSRVIDFLLSKFREFTLSILVGFMAGGLKSLWPFDCQNLYLPALLIIIGFLLIIFLEIKAKKIKKVSSSN